MRTPRQTPPQPEDPLTDEPEPNDERDDDSDLDEFDPPCTDADDARWDVFMPDDDERDPLPAPGDFWNDEFPNDE